MQSQREITSETHDDSVSETMQSPAQAQTRSTTNGNAHSWIKMLRAAPKATHPASVRFSVVCMDMENQEQRVFESIRGRLKEDMDSVEAMSRVAGVVAQRSVARAARVCAELGVGGSGEAVGGCVGMEGEMAEDNGSGSHQRQQEVDR